MDKKKEKAFPFYKNLKMRYTGGRWWVIPEEGGRWLEFAGKESDIEWRPKEEKKEFFIKVKKEFFEKNLSATEKIIFLALKFHENKKGVAWPSLGRIAKMAGVSKATIKRKLPIILKKFEIKKEEISGKSNRYFF